MSEHQDVHSVARVAATLRMVLAGFREGGERALPLLVAEQGAASRKPPSCPMTSSRPLLKD